MCHPEFRLLFEEPAFSGHPAAGAPTRWCTGLDGGGRRWAGGGAVEPLDPAPEAPSSMG